MAYVEVDLSEFSTDELIEELDYRGTHIQDKDQIYNLYRDYIDGHNFDRKLKTFFEDNLGILVH